MTDLLKSLIYFEFSEQTQMTESYDSISFEHKLFYYRQNL